MASVCQAQQERASRVAHEMMDCASTSEGAIVARQDGRYTLSADEVAALASLLGRRVVVGMHGDGDPDAAHGVETLLARGLLTQVSEGALEMSDELRLCLDTVFSFEAYLSCTGREGSQSAPTLGVFLLTGTLVSLGEEAAGRHRLVWIPVLPLAIGATAAYAEALDREEAGAPCSISVPLADVAEFRVALAEGRADILGDVLGKGGLGATLTAALVEELATGGTRRFVGISAFEGLDDLDLTLVVAAEGEYGVSVLPKKVEVTTVNRVSANHLVARWLAHACSLSLGALHEGVAQ